MTHAYVMNAANPLNYEEELNKTFELNNLPTIKTPSHPPSNMIITRCLQAEYEAGRPTEEEKTMEENSEEATDSKA